MAGHRSVPEPRGLANSSGVSIWSGYSTIHKSVFWVERSHVVIKLRIRETLTWSWFA